MIAEQERVALQTQETRERERARGLSLEHVWVFVALAVPVIAALRASLSSIDLAYGIRAGEAMLRTHALLRVDTMTFTEFGRPWLNQQWGADLLFAALYRYGGWAALALFRATLVGTVFWLVYLACRRAGASRRIGAWLTLASFAVALGGLALRSQLLGMVLFALAVWLVGERHRRPWTVWMFVPLTALWANVHGSFVLAPLLLGLAWLSDRTSPSGGRATFVAGAASAFATLANPFGWRVWTYAAGIATNREVTQFIQEWQPPTMRQYFGATFFISLAVVVVLLVRRRRDQPVPWVSLLTLGTFFALGLDAQRNVIWWALVVPPTLAGLLEVEGPRAWAPPTRLMRAVNVAIVCLLAGLGIAFLPWLRGTSAARTVSNTDAPPGITAFLRTHLPPDERLFAAQEWASWFELALPRDPVFVDARIEIFPPAVWNEYAAVSSGQQGWQRILDRWHVDAVVASFDQQGALIPRIEQDHRWRLAFRDGSGMVFVRR